MKTSLTSLTIFLCITFSSYSQTYWGYYKICNRARDSYDEKKYEDASRYFEEAFRTVENPLWNDLGKAFFTQMKLKNVEKAKEYVITRAKLYGVPISKRKFESDSLYQSMLSIAQPYIDEKNKSLNITYKTQIDSLGEVGQRIRKKGGNVYLDGINFDSLNTYNLLVLIDKYGFPKAEEVGIRALYKAHLIFLHSDFDRENELLGELLYDAVEHGWILPQDYATIYDRRMNYKGQSMYYYTAPFGYDELTQEEKDEVTRRRNAIGLRSVEKSLTWSFNNGTLQVDSKD